MSAPKKTEKPAGKGIKLPIKVPTLPSVNINPSSIDGTFILSMLLVGGLSAGSAALAIRFAMPAQVVVQRPMDADQQQGRAYNPKGFPDITTGPNVTTDFSLSMERPVVSETAYIHPQASVIGYVTIGDHVFVAPQASIRADEGKNIAIGNDSNVQDGVVLHALPTEEKGVKKMENVVVVNGEEYALFVGDRVTLSPQCQVYGPAVVADDSFIGMQALVYKARVGSGCVLEPRAAVIGVSVPDKHYVPAGMVVTTQDQADKLPAIDPGYAYKDSGALAVRVNTQLAQGYQGLHPSEGN